MHSMRFPQLIVANGSVTQIILISLVNISQQPCLFMKEVLAVDGIKARRVIDSKRRMIARHFADRGKQSNCRAELFVPRGTAG
jgi:hypothetical protein